jgi:hypothetical protein
MVSRMALCSSVNFMMTPYYLYVQRLAE